MEKIYCKYKKFKVPIIYTIFYNYLVLIKLDIDTIIYDEIVKLQRNRKNNIFCYNIKILMLKDVIYPVNIIFITSVYIFAYTQELWMVIKRITYTNSIVLHSVL